MPGERLSGAAESYYQALQARVAAWLATDAASGVPCARLYRHLPDLYRFLVALALDTRLPASERGGLVSTLKYIVAPHDYIPEAILGVPGLCDDLVLAALAVDRLHQTCDPGPLDEHWHVGGSPREVAGEILDAAGDLVDREILRRLEALLPA
ncbi:MAG TPA: DUF1232 domain-containing protein [Thermoanaerobaculaceae bacterium]|nr:DUF1232 domain-containing protein [Thermoanaerobaculaceae bacterium]HRS17092.1 DUF1232 domain-containing protein [Thermoanaerobaculaceae bacterium]